MSTEEFYETPVELAERLRRPPNWLAKMRMRGDGPEYVKIGGKVLYPRSKSDAWMALNIRNCTAQNR
jgi:hypothetical protein